MIDSIKLNNVVDYSKKKRESKKLSLENFVTVDNMLQNKSGITKAVKLPLQGGTVSSFSHGNILVGNIRPYLKKIWFADREGGCSADVLNFEVKKGYHPKYVFYTLFRDDFFSHMMRGKKGTKMPRGDKSQILDFIIPDYEFPKQESIALVLSALDSKIELNNKINAVLEEMAKTLYDYWFVQCDFPSKDGKPYKSSNGKMVWNEELKREIPDGWNVGTVGSLLARDIAIRKVPASEIKSTGKTPVVDQSTDFITGFTDDIASVIKTDKPWIIFGDHTRILKFINFDFARGADGTQLILSNSESMPQSLFYHSLLKIDLSNYGYARHFKFLKDSKIVLPEEEIAHKFEMMTIKSFELIKHNMFQNRELTKLRDWLLPLLMNGQVTVK